MYSVFLIVVLFFFLNKFLIFCLNFCLLCEEIVVIGTATDGFTLPIIFLRKDDKFLLLFTDTGYFPFIYMCFLIVHFLHSVFILSALV